MTELSSNHTPRSVVLTVEDVGRWKADLRRNLATIELLSSENQMLGKKLQAAAFFLDVDAVPESEPTVQDKEPEANKEEVGPVALISNEERPRRARRRKSSGEPTWADVVQDAVVPAVMGLTYAELRTAVFGSALGHKLEHSDKGYHNAISRLATDGVIVRDYGRVFTPEAHQRFQKAVEAGEASPTVSQPIAYSPMGEAILAIVGQRPGELNGKGVIAELRKDAEHNATLTPHETGAYNIIARLVRRGQIVRRDDGLLAPGQNYPKNFGSLKPKTNGALNGHAVSAPFAGRAATLPFENRGTKTRHG